MAAEDDSLGSVEGVSYAEELSVEDENALTEEELETLVYRAMARLELLRGHEFTESVAVEIINREEFNATVTAARDDEWENIRWQALFVVGQDQNVSDRFDEALEVGVQGYYSPAAKEVVIVTDGETAAIDKGTLVHELVHALQDQQFGLGELPSSADERLAYESVIEGEAELLPERYLNRCGIEWTCIQPEASAGASMDVELGIQLWLLKPYARGPEFIAAIEDRGGWDAVDELYEQPPASATQVIHPERYPDTVPTNVTVSDRSNDQWDRFDREQKTDTLGETALFTMFKHNGIISVDDPLSYEHPYSDGWAGDEFVPYHSGDELGYVWTTEWRTEADAEQFHSAYERLLENHNALERGEDTVLIPDGPFAGAYRVTRTETTLTIVYGPDVSSLDTIHG